MLLAYLVLVLQFFWVFCNAQCSQPLGQRLGCGILGEVSFSSSSMRGPVSLQPSCGDRTMTKEKRVLFLPSFSGAYTFKLSPAAASGLMWRPILSVATADSASLCPVLSVQCARSSAAGVAATLINVNLVANQLYSIAAYVFSDGPDYGGTFSVTCPVTTTTVRTTTTPSFTTSPISFGCPCQLPQTCLNVRMSRYCTGSSSCSSVSTCPSFRNWNICGLSSDATSSNKIRIENSIMPCAFPCTSSTTCGLCIRDSSGNILFEQNANDCNYSGRIAVSFVITAFVLIAVFVVN